MAQPNVRFSLAKKLILVFTALSVAYLALLAYTLVQFHRLSFELDQLVSVQIPLVNQAGALLEHQASRRSFVEESILLHATGRGTPEEFAALGAKFQASSREAAAVFGDTAEGREFQADLQTLLEVERADGHVDQKRNALLDPKRIVSLFEDYSQKAKVVFLENFNKEEASAELARLNEAGQLLRAHLQEFSSLILEFSAEDSAELLRREQQLIQSSAILGAVILAGSIIFIVWFVRRITGPLDELTAHSSLIAQSNLAGTPANISTGDELEILGDSFNTMRASLRTQIEEIRRSVEMLSAAISQIGASIQEQAASAKEEAATIQEITTTMQEIQQSGVEISQRAREVSGAAENTLDTGEEGLAAVQKTAQSMERIREQVEEVAEKIVNLSEKTQAIGEIVATVNEIAEQSNILAINASIEAASAGEKGSRFSVVAQEMKHLADQAKSSTRQVRGILEDIQKGINTSVMLTEEAVKRAEAGKGQAEVARTTIHKLADSTQGSVQAFQQIIAGTNQQQIGINQIVQGMQDIKQAVQQTVAGISQLEQATRSLNEMSGSLRSFINRYKL